MVGGLRDELLAAPVIDGSWHGPGIPYDVTPLRQWRKQVTMPSTPHERLLRSMYEAFNARDVDTCLAAMAPDVDWANGWEGGRVVGRDAVREYWERQWAAIDSTAEPTGVTERPDGTVEVAVHLVARDRDGNVVSDTHGRHVYALRGELVERMTIESS